MTLTRRRFLAVACATTVGGLAPGLAASGSARGSHGEEAGLPSGRATKPVSLPHFPSRLHAFVWRNWQLVPLARLAEVVWATPRQIEELGRAMGLPGQPTISLDQRRRSAITVIRRNWHLLPYSQLLALLDWTPQKLAFALREDDFLFVKLGSLKPACEALRYAPSTPELRLQEQHLAQTVRRAFQEGPCALEEPLFSFVQQLSAAPGTAQGTIPPSATISPRFCYSYFALYGDPLLETEVNPYPDGYLARLAGSGVDGVWLQGVLYQLALFPWQTDLSARFQERLDRLNELVQRARKFGIGIYLYLNEPRAMPAGFFESHPGLRGVSEGDHSALCTSADEVRDYLSRSITAICKATPQLGGFFTITGSENLTNCWSHGSGGGCPRCGKRPPADVIAEVNRSIAKGIRDARSSARLIAWDWGWADEWSEAIIRQLPSEAALMSVSEWGIPIQRGGVATTVGEYSISTIGPGARARRHWDWARQRGLKTVAKIQAGNTWEFSAAPYIPALANVAEHAVNLRGAQIDGLMLGWTLGGYPSPNLEVVAEVMSPPQRGQGPVSAQGALQRVATRRFGPELAESVCMAWRQFSAGFSEFPFSSGLVYQAPMQFGPSNLLWMEPTGYAATMIGFPYDDLDAWRQVYPAETFIAQMEKVADGFDRGIGTLRGALRGASTKLRSSHRNAAESELRVAETAAISFRSTANQARFVMARRTLSSSSDPEQARGAIRALEIILEAEIGLALRLHALQCRDSRVGFEASNQYYYVPLDLAEKVINCRHLLEHWLPAERRKHG